MMIYRSLVVGLLGAIALLLAEQGAASDRDRHRRDDAHARAWADDLAEEEYAAGLPGPRAWAAPRAPVADAPPVVVHISRARAGDDPVTALGLDAADLPVAIDDRPIVGRWRDAVRARWLELRAGDYLELWLRRAGTLQRMVVLVTA
jgi:hypothetical protein